jgi:hypothetical protein
MEVCFADKESKTYDEFLESIEGKTTGAVRVSLGVASNFADVYRFMEFAQSYIDRSVAVPEEEVARPFGH